MKVLLISIMLHSLSAHAWDFFHYPEDRIYSANDRGYTQYGAPSLFKSAKYALTFDDGPHPTRTPKLLDVLKENNAKATFFIITSRINNSTLPIIKRMLDDGHIVASHGQDHDNSNNVSKAVWKKKVKDSFITLAKIYRQAGHELKMPYYRFPYAAYGKRSDHHHLNTLREISLELTGKNCIHFAFWDIDSGDWIPGMDSADVANNLITTAEGGRFITYKNVRNSQGRLIQVKKETAISNPPSGGVILQHDIQANAVEATKSFLEYASLNKLEIVPLNEVSEFEITRDCKFL